MTIHSVVIQKLLSTSAHMGRRVAAHHFKIYTYGVRNNTAIIDSDKTLICLRNACNFIGNLVRLKGRFLFVNTNPLFDEIIEQMTQKIGCRNDNSWRLGGFLTNSSSPRKFRSRHKKLNLGMIQSPDCVVIMDTERKSSVILEADRLQIPIVGLVDSSMPWETYKRITYPVPANDSVQFVYLFCNLITKTFLFEQKRYAAATGSVITGKEEETGETAHPIVKSKIEGSDVELLILPYESLLSVSDDSSETKMLLDKLAVVKINRDVGSKMDFFLAKSATEICDGLTCVDFTANHIESVNSKFGCNIPLLLINGVNTNNEILKILGKHPTKNIQSFIQDQYHGVNAENFVPLPLEEKTTENEPLYASNHIEILMSLKNSGKLDLLLSQGKEYIVIINSDNLACVVDPKILNHLIKNDAEICMEVLPSSPSQDESVLPKDGKLQSEEKFKLIGTLWVDIKAIDAFLVTAVQKQSYPISKFFDRAVGINVLGSRFLPLETTSDLFLYQSDLYSCSGGILTRNEARTTPANPSVRLGPAFEKLSDFRSRFKSIPSIIELDSLKVDGDVWFGTGITLKGKVSITAPPDMRIVIPDGTLLKNRVIYSQRDL